MSAEGDIELNASECKQLQWEKLTEWLNIESNRELANGYLTVCNEFGALDYGQIVQAMYENIVKRTGWPYEPIILPPRI